jgi:hypothetical protein
MQLGTVGIRRGVFLLLALSALGACRETPTAPVPTLRIRNDTRDTLVYSVTERETARRQIVLGLLDTAGGIRQYSRAPNAVWSNSTENIWGYVAGADIHIDLYRVTGLTLAFAGMLDVTDAELVRANYLVAIPPSALSQ